MLQAVVDDNTFAVGESVHFLFCAGGGITALQYDVPHHYHGGEVLWGGAFFCCR